MRFQGGHLRSRASTRLRAWLGTVVLGVGCTDAVGEDVEPTGTPPDPGYVVSAAVFSPEGINSYVGTVPTLGAEATLDPTRTIEVPGLSLLYVQEGSGAFFVDSVTGLTLTKYTVTDNVPEQQGQLGFSGLGFATTQRISANVFASATRAYLVDSGTLQLVIWNPEAMTIEETIGLDELARDEPAFVYQPVVRDGVAYFPFAYSDPVEDVVRPESVVLAIDLDDASRTILTDDACGDAIYPLLTDSGDIYLGSGTVNAATEFLGRPTAGASCLRRIPAGSMAFDADYHPSISSFVDGDYAGGLIAGPDGDVYIRVLDDSVVPDDLATSSQVVAAPIWSWWRVDLEDGTATRAALEPSAGRFTVFEVQGRTFATQSSADFARTTLLETTVEPPEPRLELLGIASGLGAL